MGYDLESQKKSSNTRGIILAILGAGVLIAVGLAIGLAIGLRSRDKDIIYVNVTDTGPEGQGYKSANGKYRYAAVVSDASICAKIGTEIMARDQGNVVDATVAAVICGGLMNCHSAGIGGGALIVYYNRTSRQAQAFNARERAPANATEDMFVANPINSTYGGLSIGVPGELKGLWDLHQLYGKLEWRKLLQPTIELCENGVPMTSSLHNAANARKSVIGKDPEYSFLYDEHGEPYPAGYMIKRTKLARTLRTIADEGADAFYNGSLSNDIVQDIQDRGGIITRADLAQYYVDIGDPVTLNLTSDNLTLYSSGSPGSGVVLAYIINILSGYNFGPDSISTTKKAVLTYHRIAEAMKFAYARRSELGDAKFVNITELVANMTSQAVGEETRDKIDDNRTHDWQYYGGKFDGIDNHGTSNFALMDVNGDVVCITSTVNLYFGSKVKGTRSGIIFNDEMDDFSTPNTTNAFGVPASPANFIRPGKRPLSSMTPTVVVDSSTGEPQLVVGASGGTRITTAVALTIMKTLWFNETVTKAVDEPRIHHQLRPEILYLEEGFDQAIWDGLARIDPSTTVDDDGSVVTAIRRTSDGVLEAVSDWRKGGAPDGF